MVSKVITFFMDRPDFGNFPKLLHHSVSNYPPLCEMFALAAFSARSIAVEIQAFRQIGNKSKAFLEKLPINPRVSSVRWAALRAPLNFKIS